jgi:peptidoglycan/LPS O-acetylase OafA/YrhL
MGQVSFSAYLVHFAVLRLFPAFPELLQSQATGVRAIVAFAAGWPVAVGLTFIASKVSYLAIEKPMIEAGKALIRSRRLTPSARPVRLSR